MVRIHSPRPSTASRQDLPHPLRAAYVDNTNAPTYENTLTALEDITEDLERGMGIARHLESVASSPALRAAVNAVLPKYSEFASSIILDQGI